ncbi:MAG: PEP-CTERM sorting domain-containing protein [Sulfuritalea sp.]|nr:PEP-CTERM sorting domain-containing protein [Sulfuritalea sp.]
MRLKIISVCLVLAMQMGIGTAQAETYPLGQFNVTSGFTIFADDFADGIQPPSGPWGASSYWGLHGSFPAGVEAGGALVLDPATNGAPVPGFPGRVSVAGYAPIWNQLGTPFLISGAFALKAPLSGDVYGLNARKYSWDGTAFVNDNLALMLRVGNVGGSPFVQLATVDYASSVVTILGSQAISTSGHTGLGLYLAYDGAAPIHAAYQYFDGTTPFGTPVSVGSAAYGGDAHRLGFFASAPIPEPETYAMLLAGLGLLGLIARRRRVD